MALIPIHDNPQVDFDLRAYEVSDRAHADLFNAVSEQLINNDKALDDRMRDVELFKFPNAIQIGNPIENKGQISGFSSDDYYIFPYVVTFNDRPFEINTEVTTRDNVSTAQKIFDARFGFSFGIDGGKFLLAISSNGTSWDIVNTTGDFDVSPNTTYRLRLSWSGTEYKLSVSTDGGESYTDDITVSSELSPYPEQVYIGIRHDLTSPFLGIINLNRSSLLINSVLEWQGMDDVGISSRLDRDVSNLNPAGEQKIKDIVQPNIDEIKEEVKQSHLVFSNILVPTSSFVEDSTYEDYPYKVSIPLEGVTSNSILTVNFGMKDATGGVYSPIAESDDGIGYIYANAIPEESLVIPTILSVEEVV